MRKLHLVRHSRPVIDPAQPALAWHLSPSGSRLSVLVAERLATAEVDAVVSSVEPRAEESGRIIADRLGVPFRTAEGLEEQHRDGAWLESEEEFRAAVAGFFAEPDRQAFGPESADAAHARFAAALDRVTAADSGDLAVVSHGRVISLFVARANGLEALALWNSLGLPALVTVDWPTGRLVEIVANF